MSLDYVSLGVKIGLEIHQQLDTERKLFCGCPTSGGSEEPHFRFERRLRPSQSELGEVDPAALFEFRRGRVVVYEGDPDTCCLVEMDEEPPRSLNRQAVEVGLQLALMLDAKPVDEIHVMRKIVIDGSNTCGFQRTCVIAFGGGIKVGEKKIPIQTICLEEDAARKIGEEDEGRRVVYRLDRLGVPLIEIATAPEIASPEEAEKAALAIGRLLRATRRVKRGLGTIRQDLNISISGGALIEVKGVQKLDLIGKVVEFEVRRQLGLLRLREELEARGANREELVEEFHDVTEIFRETSSRALKSALERGGVVLAVRLRRFSGLLGREVAPGLRLGTEMADRARFWGRVGGIFHTDELPGYGIKAEEVQALKERLQISQADAAVIVAAKPENAKDALKAVLERAAEALEGVPSETRAATADGATRYMRPRPGAARMYPETDVPPLEVCPQLLERLKSSLPSTFDEVADVLVRRYGVNRKLAEQLADSDYLHLFERVVGELRVAPSFAATALTETLRSLGREGVPVESLPEEQLFEAFKLVGEGRMAKEAFAEVIAWSAKNRAAVAEALEKLGITMLDAAQIGELVERKAKAHLQSLKAQAPQRLVDQLMKLVMGEIRGRADAKVVLEVVRRKAEEIARSV